MAIKYQKQISNFECDLSLFQENDRIAFHWVFEPISNIKNFIPVYIKQPLRPQNTCNGYALSFFNSQEEAKIRLLELSEGKPNIFKKLGTDIAEGNLVRTDGISNRSNDGGHFEHFEYADIDLNSKFTIVEKVGAL